jgi:hypothetical protein
MVLYSLRNTYLKFADPVSEKFGFDNNSSLTLSPISNLSLLLVALVPDSWFD